MKILRNLFIIFVVSFGLVFGGLYYLNNNEDKDGNDSDVEDSQEENSEDKSEVENVIKEEELILYAEEDEQTAFDLLKNNAIVDYEDSDFGVFVKSINDLAGDDKNYWALYVNDEYSQTGADTTVLEEGDKTTWKYEEIVY